MLFYITIFFLLLPSLNKPLKDFDCHWTVRGGGSRETDQYENAIKHAESPESAVDMVVADCEAVPKDHWGNSKQCVNIFCK